MNQFFNINFRWYRRPILFIKKILKKWVETVLIFVILKHNIRKAGFRPAEIHNVLIPLMHGIGDVIIFTACLHRLRSIFPNANYYALVTNRTNGVLEDTFADDFTFIRFESFKRLRPFRRKFDIMIAPSRNINHYLIALIIKPNYLVGYNYSIHIRKNESHIWRANRLLHELGDDEVTATPSIRISDETMEKTHQMLSTMIKDMSKKLVSIIAGGRWYTKTYSSERYRILIERLLKEYKINVALIGTNSDIGSHINHTDSVYNFVDQTSIKDVMGIIAHSELVIGPDGGLLNIAMGLKKPIVGLFGPVNPETIVPDHYRNSVLFNKRCKYQPCYNEEAEPPCVYERAYCMDIEVDDIIKKIDEMVENFHIDLH